jgi:hypothetical protein
MGIDGKVNLAAFDPDAATPASHAAPSQDRRPLSNPPPEPAFVMINELVVALFAARSSDDQNLLGATGRLLLSIVRVIVP